MESNQGIKSKPVSFHEDTIFIETKHHAKKEHVINQAWNLVCISETSIQSHDHERLFGALGNMLTKSRKALANILQNEMDTKGALVTKSK